MRDNTTHYRDLFLNDVPLMDARAPSLGCSTCR